MDDIKAKIIPILKKYRVKKAALFGSYVRGENTEKSDIDILIAPPKAMDLIGFIGVKQDLEEVLGRKVDLVSYGTIREELRESILENEQLFYEEK